MIFRFWAILGAIETQLEKASENTVTATSEVSEGVKTLSVSEGGRKIEKKRNLILQLLKIPRLHMKPTRMDSATGKQL